MTDHLPESPEVVLTEAERDWLHEIWDDETTISAQSFFPAIARLIAARLTAQDAEHEREVADGLARVVLAMDMAAIEQRDHAETAERALADLRAGIEALADEWEGKTFRSVAAEQLRAVLATEDRHDESEEG